MATNKEIVLLNDVPGVGKHGHVLEVDPELAKSLKASGQADDNPKAVAYAVKNHPQPEAAEAVESNEGGEIVK
jgi:hypothetical protein